MFTSHRQRLVVALAGVAAAAAVSLAGLHTDAGYTKVITNATNTVSSSVKVGTCTDAMTRDGALWAFALRDTGSTAADFTIPSTPGSYQNSGLLQTGVNHQGGPNGCTRDTAGYVSLLGLDNGNTGGAGWVNGPAAGLPANSLTAGFTGEVWFRTNTALGGNLLALGNANFTANLLGTPIALSTRKDHQIFMLANGQLSFAMYKGTNLQITTAAAYNDNQWHHVVATVSPTTGSALYVDGALIGTQPTATSGDIDAITSYLHLGYESLQGWTGSPSRYAWTGDLAYAGLYTSPLTATQVLTHYRAGLA